MASQLVTWALTFALTIILPRYLGAVNAGKLTIANSIWAIVAIIATFGMDTLLTKEIARKPAQAARLFGASVALRAILFLLAANTPESIGSGLRRASDFLIALALSVIALPIAIVIGLFAWIGARGKLFARKARIGSHGEAADNSTTFDLVHFATRADSRIGAWLERWELNRLPELWNVLRGDLNLVGVKPLTRAEMNFISEEW
jgi:hypothetical protein